MKTIIGFTVTAMLITLATSCKKSSNAPIKLSERYYYYIVDRDWDDSTMRTPIYVVNNGKDTIVKTQVTDDDDKDFCKKHPSAPTCRPMPVTFTNVSFTKTSDTWVQGTWTAATEANVRWYEVWRSTDGVNFFLKAVFPPKGQGSIYTVNDDMSK